jgi:regulator of protease activity HflC (stomatin/prohibitin superfamily)
MSVKFPFPADSEKWQTAFTADNAYYDAGAISPTASFIGRAAFIAVWVYSIVFLFAQLPMSGKLFHLDSQFQEEFERGQITEALREAFRSQGWVLTNTASLSIKQADSEWEIQDEAILYIIQNRHSELSVRGETKGIMFLFLLFQLSQDHSEALDMSQITDPIREVFTNNEIELTVAAIVIVDKAGNKWTIRDANRQHLIQREGQILKVYGKQKEGFVIAVFIIITMLVYLAFYLVKKIALRRTEGFFRQFYQPPENVNPAEAIKYRIKNRIKLPMPFSEWFPSIAQFKYVLVRYGEFLNKDSWPVWLAHNIGGPILLVIYDGSALYLERGNRFSRIVGPGVALLERHETIKYAVDLRNKVKEIKEDKERIKVWTKDGIVIELKIRIEYRIGDPQKVSISSSLIHPYEPEAVKKAIERHALRWTDPQKEPKEFTEFTWEDAVWGQVTGVIPSYIGRRFLDDLLVADRRGGQILSPNTADEIFNALNKATNVFGVHVTDFQILSVELPKKANEQYVKYWEAERQSLATIMDGKAKAFNIRAHEKARAEAQHDLILAISDGLKKNDKGQLTEALLLSLSEVLDHGLNDSYMRSYTAKETLETLEIIRSMLKDNSE